MKILTTILISLVILGCSSRKGLINYKPSVVSSKENVSIIKSDIINGYIYRVKQKKCPGTTLSESNTCYRVAQIVSEKRINNIDDVFVNDSVNLSKSNTYALDYHKLLFTVPADLLTEYGIDLNSEYMSEASFYFDGLMNEEGCTYIEKSKNLEIKECKINSERVIYLSFDKELAEFITSPNTGKANYGMPLAQYDDFLTVAWLVPKNSPIYKKIFTE